MPRRERSSTSLRAVSSGQPRPMDGCVFPPRVTQSLPAVVRAQAHKARHSRCSRTVADCPVFPVHQ
jgi:hypothetical protein